MPAAWPYMVLLMLALPFRDGQVAPLTTTLPDPAPLFATEDPIDLVIKAKISELWADRSKNSEYHPAAIGIRQPTGKLDFFGARIRTRGHFRKQRQICTNPPLLLNLDKQAPLKGTLLQGQNKLKLVLPCTTDELVIREFILYKIYNLLTPMSLKVRPCRVILEDSAGISPRDTLSGFLLEPTRQAAQRNGMIELDKNGLNPQYLVPSDFHLMALFQYFAGNTDWSVQYQHNIELVAPNEKSMPTPVPYDFDHSGLVSAPYAKPAEELQLSSVLIRRYRGYCLQNLAQLEPYFALFNEKRSEIEKLYRETPGLSPRYRERALQYIEVFYRTINNRKKAESDFFYPCIPEGTGQVVIKGMKEE